MPVGLASDGLGSGGFDSDDLPISESGFFPVPLASPGLALGFFLSAGTTFSSPLALRLVARREPVSTDLT
jgi:hypothetical protein